MRQSKTGILRLQHPPRARVKRKNWKGRPNIGIL